MKQPLRMRQRNFFRYMQPKTQLITDFISDVETMAHGADISNITYEVLLANVVINATTDKYIRNEFYKLKEPTINDLRVRAKEILMYRRENNQPLIPVVKDNNNKAMVANSSTSKTMEKEKSTPASNAESKDIQPGNAERIQPP